MFESIWNEVEIERRPKLTENKKTEVVIVGAGLTGLLIAYYLQEDGMNVIVLEGDRIGCGMTRNTTAKITSQHGLIYHKLIEDKGYEYAKQYAEINQHAIERYEETIQIEGIACDFERRNAYLFGKGGGDALR
ncbi:MAG: FAD-binding oxidoreductase, partial [Clostridium sp.]|nr:FAD-binding oxidoreductase [Clostridium sp.]